MSEVRKKQGLLLVSTFLGVLLRGAILIYRYTLSYWLGRHCRFEPTCSVYAADAIRLHGPFTGVRLAFRRLSRCHPWGGSGFDPVEELEPKGDEVSGLLLKDDT